MPSSRSPRNRRSSTTSPRRLHPPPRRNPLTFVRLMNLMDDPAIHLQMQADLLGRNDLLVQMAMITHIRRTIDNLEAEMHRQWEAAEEYYGIMERNGLEGELGEYATQIPLQSSPTPSNNDEPLPPYRRSPSPGPSTRRRRPTPDVTIVFRDFPPQPQPLQRPRQSRQQTPLQSSPIGSQENPILVEESNDDTMSCNVCRSWGHEWINCHEYQCEYCGVFGPGHTLSDCYYR